MSHLGRGCVARPSHPPRLLVLTLALGQREAAGCHSLTGGAPSQSLLQGPHKAFRTAVACGCADKGGRTGEAHKGPCRLQPMRHLLTAMLLPEPPAPGALR